MNNVTLSQLRTFNLASIELMPLIKDLHNTAYTKLLMEFRGGSEGKHILPLVARCEAYQSIIEEIEARNTMYQNHVNKKETT